jgi:hypothetical protein
VWADQVVFFRPSFNDLAFGQHRLLHGNFSYFYFAMSFLLFLGPILGEGYPSIYAE